MQITSVGVFHEHAQLVGIKVEKGTLVLDDSRDVDRGEQAYLVEGTFLFLLTQTIQLD